MSQQPLTPAEKAFKNQWRTDNLNDHWTAIHDFWQDGNSQALLAYCSASDNENAIEEVEELEYSEMYLSDQDGDYTEYKIRVESTISQFIDKYYNND